MRNMRHELYGESVFTSFRSWDGEVFGFESHLNRLYLAVQQVYGLNSMTLESFMKFLLSDYNFAELFIEKPNNYFRVTIYADCETSLSKTKFSLSDLCLNLSTRPILNYSSAGVSLKSFSSPFSKHYIPIKSGSYFQNLQFRKKAIHDGYDDALFTIDSEVVEASTSNIVFERDGEFYTPSGEHFLRGITLKLFQSFCKEKNQEFHLSAIKSTDLAKFNSAFLLNSVQGIVSIKQIDTVNFLLDDLNKLNENFINYCKDET